MNNITTKRVISVFICIAIIFSMMIPCALSATAEDINEVSVTCPIIYVHGFGSGDIYANIGTDQETVVWPVDGNTITSAVETAIEPVISSLLTCNYSKFEDTLVEVANSLLAPARNNKDGTIPEGTGIKWSYPSHIAKNSYVSFRYDWRNDPIVVADELNEFINYATKKSGSDKVAIECHSMGGVVILSYIAKYGTDKIQGIILDSTAIKGAGYMGKLFSGDMVVDDEALYSYLLYLMTGNEYEQILDLVFDALYAAGIFSVVEIMGEELLERSLRRVYKEVLVPLFGSWPSMWAMIGDDEYLECESFVFDDLLADETEEYAALREKLQVFNNDVRPYKDQILYSLAETGHFMVISKYGFSMAPVTDTWKTMSDGTIDTYYTSFGATTASYGSTLSDDYLTNNASLGYISADKMIDASTCMFPDNTWFLKDEQHSTGTSELQALKNAVLFSNSPVTIKTYNAYPQYLIRSGDKFVPFVDYEEPDMNILYEYGNLMQRIRDKIEEILLTLIDKVKSIFSITISE